MKDRLKSFFTAHWTYMAVQTACKLDLFDHLINGQNAHDLAADLNLDKKTLHLLLEALYNEGFLDKNEGIYAANTLSAFLTDQHEESLKYACLNWSAEHLDAWQHLDFSIKTGKSAFEDLYGMPFFDYLDKHPQKHKEYHLAMNAYALDDYKSLPEVIDFSIHESLMDVGGSYGALLKAVKAKNPNLECILFDNAKTVADAPFDCGVKCAGNFFEDIPKRAEAMVLSRILHDWDDNKCLTILKNCHDSLPENGTLYIIENCVDGIDVDLSLLSLNMTAICESFERSAVEYNELCEGAGFKFSSATKLNAIQTILTFKK